MTKQKYNNVYFRINAGYQWGEGMSEEQSKLFKEEIIAIFVADGWTVTDREHRSYSPVASKGKQSLYLHPMEFSGNILADNIEHIDAILSTAKTFQCYRTDVYKEVFDMTKKEYLTHLEGKCQEIAEDILRLFTTKRRNLYVSQTHIVISNVASKYSLEQLDKDCKNLDTFYVTQVFNVLVEQQRLVTAKTKHGTGYRTATSKDILKEAL